ncbi:hypothetical protein LC55x_1243 [Lysobacter capsici]|nr:hypothetical protein LC55x_1243 [Lysobacter capsici]
MLGDFGHEYGAPGARRPVRGRRRLYLWTAAGLGMPWRTPPRPFHRPEVSAVGPSGRTRSGPAARSQRKTSAQDPTNDLEAPRLIPIPDSRFPAVNESRH